MVPSAPLSFPTVLTYGSDIRRVTTYQRARFGASVEYSYTLSTYQRENALLHGFLDALGVNFDPRIIWNAIPWSFAVDWVLGVNQWLRQFRTRLIEPQTVIYRFLWSIDIRRSVLCYFKTGTSAYYVGHGEQPMYLLTERAYKRVPCQPDIYSSLTRSGINSHEFLLAASLAVTR